MSIVFNGDSIAKISNEKLNIARCDSDFKFNNIYYTLKGEPWYVVSGEFQYSRYSNEEWEEEIAKMKAGGVNVVACYSFWNHHEYEQGQWNFSGDMDIKKFLTLCQKQGMKVILRTGPFCHGEAIYGGFPKYISKMVTKRTNCPKYLSYVKVMYQKYFEQVKDFFYDGKNGCVIGMQLENEHTGSADHIMKLKEIVCEIGFNLPMYTATAWSGGIPNGEVVALFGSYPEAPWDASWSKPIPNGDRFKICNVIIDEVVGNDSQALKRSLRKEETNKAIKSCPLSMCELGAGVQATAHRRPFISTKDAYTMCFVNLSRGVNMIGYYVYHGGRNPNFAPLQETRKTLYPNNLPLLTYDFQAPLGEFGLPKEKFFYLRTLHYFCTTFDMCDKQTVYMNKDDFDSVKNKFTAGLRINDKGEGFCFVNTYERNDLDKGVENFAPMVSQNGNTIQLPSVSLPNGESFVYPFNMPFGDNVFKYITAQPLLKIKKDGVTRLLFIKHPNNKVMFEASKPLTINGKELLNGELEATNGKVATYTSGKESFDIEVYDRETALSIYFDELSNDIIISKNFVYRNEKGLVELHIDGELSNNLIKINRVDNRKMPCDKYFYRKYKLGTFEMIVDKNIFNDVDDVKVKFLSNCDMAHFYCDGKVIADYIKISDNFEICLARFKKHILNGDKIIIKTKAVRPNQKTYYECKTITKDNDIKVDKINSIVKKYK